jgi:polysaccharide export outer membrane protein
MLQRLIRVEGLLPSAVEAAVVTALQAEKLMVDPIVTITIVEYHSHTVSVAGAVKTPVTFQAVAPVTLLEAITRAGGLAPDAGLEILVSRTKRIPGDQPMVLTQRIPVRALIEASDPDLNVTLTGGEEVRVPEIGKIFVVGNVKKSGAFPVQDSSETTVLQMLALAEGLFGLTGKEAFIYRRDANGTKSEIPIQLKAIMDRKSPDVSLVANDILYVPENKSKKMSLAVIEKVLLFGTTAGATALTYGMIR